MPLKAVPYQPRRRRSPPLASGTKHFSPPSFLPGRPGSTRVVKQKKIRVNTDTPTITHVFAAVTSPDVEVYGGRCFASTAHGPHLPAYFCDATFRNLQASMGGFDLVLAIGDCMSVIGAERSMDASTSTDSTSPQELIGKPYSLIASNLRVGQSLQSCTNTVQVALPFKLDERSFTRYASGKKLAGVVYMYRISNMRMGDISTQL
ncbi:hypothetical protein C8R45DRAFT_1088130 [Mycena sanguinolenta]|nr:hypothetical protein C8R45DRAFT_1088130 [Mycena sanguinolenta]